MNDSLHPTLGQIADLSAGALPPADAIRINAHLAGCAECGRIRDELAGVVELLGEVGNAPPAPMPADLAAALDSVITDESLARSRGAASANGRAKRSRMRLLAAAAAALVVVGIGTAVIRSDLSGPSTSNDADHAQTAAGDDHSAMKDEAPGGASEKTQGLVGGAEQTPPGPQSSSETQLGERLPHLSSDQLPQLARLLVRQPRLAISPQDAGCSDPVGSGITSTAVIAGHVVVLAIDPDARTVRVYDCATARRRLATVRF